MTQSERDKVNATQDGIGTTKIKPISLLCGQVPKVRDATFKIVVYLCQVSKLQNHVDR